MSEDAPVSVDLHWFCNHLRLEDQVSLLRNPYAPLPLALADQLIRTPGAFSGGWLSSGSDPKDCELAPPAAARLEQIRLELNGWWSSEALTPDQRAHIVENRRGWLHKDHADAIRKADRPGIYEVHLVPDNRQPELFRLPQMLQVYVEMKATEPSS